jgi:hypothetical protein
MAETGREPSQRCLAVLAHPGLGQLRHQRRHQLSERCLSLVCRCRHGRTGQGVAQLGADHRRDHEPGSEAAQLAGEQPTFSAHLADGQHLRRIQERDCPTERTQTASSLVTRESLHPPGLGILFHRDPLLDCLTQHMLGQTVLDLRMHLVPGGELRLPAAAFPLVHDHEGPALVLTGANPPGPAEHLLHGAYVERVQADLGVLDDHGTGGQIHPGRHGRGRDEHVHVTSPECLLSLPAMFPSLVVQPDPGLTAHLFQPFHVISPHAGDLNRPARGDHQGGAADVALAAAEHQHTAPVASDQPGDRCGEPDTRRIRHRKVAVGRDSGKLPGETGWPPARPKQPGPQPFCDLCGVGDSRREPDNPGADLTVAYPGQQRFQCRPASGIAQHVDLIDNQRTNLSQGFPEGRCTADSLELLGRGHPQVGAVNALNINSLLAG